MAVQSRLNLTNQPFILEGDARMKVGTLTQNAQRSGALAQYTLCSITSATGLLVPFTDETTTDGTQIPQAICWSSATEAEIQAGNVTSFHYYYAGDFKFDEDQLTIENSLTLDTVITDSTKRVRDHLDDRGMHAAEAIAIEGYENT